MKIKKHEERILIAIISIVLLFAMNIAYSYAADKLTYPLLESFPGFFNRNDSPDLPTMILAIYQFGIWTVGIAGFFMLVVGGFMYMASAGNTSTSGSAKKIITDSLVGILTALAAYLILYVINPNLTVMNISFSPVVLKEVTDNGGTIVTDNGNQTTSGGCIKPVNQARQRTSWVYSQAFRGQTRNGVRYTDCSDFIKSSYKAAGCSLPGDNTASMYSNAVNFTNKNELKAGDAVVRVGHIVLCMDDGCNQVIHSPGTGKPITIKNGSWTTGKSGDWANAKVIKASNYCGRC